MSLGKVCMLYITKKIYKYVYYPLSGIHNTSLTRAYFGLDKRECECLEYLFICRHSTKYEKCRVDFFDGAWKKYYSGLGYYSDLNVVSTQ
jgi:hypothetical protein